ncbi:uncharacterized protein LOC134786903 [Penaeus indicus]|uniref:uncharacterized protein LOC134786903 n=1 Tax=Penaeus indicus TaxID=29960 RepID=UPI00300CBC76
MIPSPSIPVDADRQLNNLTRETTGASYHFIDEPYSFDLEYSLEAIQDFIPSPTKSSVLYRKTFLNVSQLTTLQEHFYVDCCLNKMGIIIDMESDDQYTPQLKDPNGQTVDGQFEKLLHAWVFDVSKPEVGSPGFFLVYLTTVSVWCRPDHSVYILGTVDSRNAIKL